MATKIPKSTPTRKIKSKKNSKSSSSKNLSRKEKLEAVRKANQALLKAIALMSQHGNENAQSDI
jgi:hypothetical protein